MPVSKKQISNAIFIIVVILLLFTPIGFHVKVYVNKLLSFSPSTIEIDEQEKLKSYDWLLVNDQGKSIDFKNEKGNVVVVNFWATWCPPCVAEMPSFQELYDDYGDKITFLFVALDDKEKVTEFILKKGYTLPIYYEVNNRPKQFNASSIPVTYVLDKKGNIIVEKTGAADWNSGNFRVLLDGLLVD